MRSDYFKYQFIALIDVERIQHVRRGQRRERTRHES